MAGCATEARLSADGAHWIISGLKKFITNGVFASFYVVLAYTDRTAGAQRGMSLFVVPREVDGLSVRKCSTGEFGAMAGTAYLEFDEVQIPRDYLIGDAPGDGWRQITSNLIHERLYVSVGELNSFLSFVSPVLLRASVLRARACQVSHPKLFQNLYTACMRFARLLLEDSIRYSMQRKTFGKALHEHQGIRMKLAKMAREIESAWAFVETMTYNMTVMSKEEALMRLGALSSLCKVQTAEVYERVALESVRVFGGQALQNGSRGSRVVGALGQTKGYTIPAGANDILDDFWARNAIRMTARYADARL